MSYLPEDHFGRLFGPCLASLDSFGPDTSSLSTLASLTIKVS
jgi:hypothetical protein